MKSLFLFTFFAIICTVFPRDCNQEYEPSGHLEHGCNGCVSDKNGKIIGSTEKKCTSQPPETGPPVICKPRSRFMIDCNTCVCSDDGTSAGCTKIGCPPRDS